MTELFESFQVKEINQIGEVRRRAGRLAQEHQFGPKLVSDVSILVTELATNLVKHTEGGQILLGVGERGLKVVSLDTGHGFTDLDLKDGTSSKNTQGSGLGAVVRLSSSFNYYSQPQHGSVIIAEIDAKARTSAQRDPPWFALRIAAPGEEQCGDSYSVFQNGDALSMLMVDGLGHGSLAAAAANEAIAMHAQKPFLNPKEFLDLAHERLRGTRGAVGLIALVDIENGSIRYAGIGNISGRVIGSDSSRYLTSHNGTIGAQSLKPQEFIAEWSAESLMVLHTDGIKTHWNLADYPGLFHRPASVIAAVLLRDCLRGRDDATVLVVRLPSRNLK